MSEEHAWRIVLTPNERLALPIGNWPGVEWTLDAHVPDLPEYFAQGSSLSIRGEDVWVEYNYTLHHIKAATSSYRAVHEIGAVKDSRSAEAWSFAVVQTVMSSAFAIDSLYGVLKYRGAFRHQSPPKSRSAALRDMAFRCAHLFGPDQHRMLSYLSEVVTARDSFVHPSGQRARPVRDPDSQLFVHPNHASAFAASAGTAFMTASMLLYSVHLRAESRCGAAWGPGLRAWLADTWEAAYAHQERTGVRLGIDQPHQKAAS